MEKKLPALRNRTLRIDAAEAGALDALCLDASSVGNTQSVLDRVVCADIKHVLPRLTPRSIDLAILDPPYNLTKQFKTLRFKRTTVSAYATWMLTWFRYLIPLLKNTASVYVCSDWSTSPAIFEVLSEHLTVRNRITWEREKGRGAAANWKNGSEDIWFATVGDSYCFNLEAVRLRRRVVAPYRDNGEAKGWQAERDGNFRLTAPSNLWTDITVPFWSMRENTEHPTQKSEKLIAKLVLASSRPGDIILDPFLGSGTTASVCRKLGRHFIGIEIDPTYCALAIKRAQRAAQDPRIQGYEDGVFCERNTMMLQMQALKPVPRAGNDGTE